MDEINLHLDQETARALYDLIYCYGEYIAAGVPLPPFSPDVEQQITRVFYDLEHQLGLESMAVAMQHTLDERSQGVLGT